MCLFFWVVSFAVARVLLHESGAPSNATNQLRAEATSLQVMGVAAQGADATGDDMNKVMGVAAQGADATGDDMNKVGVDDSTRSRNPETASADTTEVLVTAPASSTSASSADRGPIPMKLFLTSSYAALSEAPAVLQANILRTLNLNPGISMTWYDDKACLTFLQTFQDPRYASVFKSTKRPSYRSDLCRAAYLQKYGGFYTDTDVEMAVPFSNLVSKDTSFMTAWENNGTTNVLNALIGATPEHPIMAATLDLMLSARAAEAANPHPHRFKAEAIATAATEWWGPETMGSGLAQYLGSCGSSKFADPGEDLKGCDGTKIRMFQEVNMRHPSFNAALPENVVSRAFTEERQRGFDGLQYGIFWARKEQSFLVAYPRYANCQKFGCGDRGWTNQTSHKQPFAARALAKA